MLVNPRGIKTFGPSSKCWMNPRTFSSRFVYFYFSKGRLQVPNWGTSRVYETKYLFPCAMDPMGMGGKQITFDEISVASEFPRSPGISPKDSWWQKNLIRVIDAEIFEVQKWASPTSEALLPKTFEKHLFSTHRWGVNSIAFSAWIMLFSPLLLPKGQM